MIFEFRPLRREDLPMLLEWLQRPHVAEWWESESTLAEVEEEYFPPDPIATDARYIAWLDDRPVAYIQSYAAAAGVLGIDQFLGAPEDIGRGLGTALVSQFAQYLFRNPNVTRIQVDPSPANHRAIRCYEKAGFRAVGEMTTPDGAALLMTFERAELPVLVVDEAHEQVFARRTEDPDEYVVPAGVGFVLDTSGYQFQSPWNDGAVPNVIQIARREDVYMRRFDPAATRHVVSAGSIETLGGNRFDSLAAGDQLVIAIGRVIEDGEGPTLRPFWVAGVNVTAP